MRERAVKETKFGNVEIELMRGKLKTLHFTTDQASSNSPSNEMKNIFQLLDDYEAGKPIVVPEIEFDGTEFQKSVWAEIAQIAPGETASYGEIAHSIGKPKAARAVGGAVGANPVAILVGCHRVMGSTGKLTGYTGGGGLDTKAALLAHEQQHFSK